MMPLYSPLACTAAEALQTSQPSSFAHRAKLSRAHCSRSCLYAATWNIRSLLDTEGPIETARQRSEEKGAEDRRVDLVVRELDRYGVKIAALQETKWFGNAVYRVGDSVVLAAGRPTPEPDEPRQRGEGVAIVLIGLAISAWKADGECWKAWSSRLITARLRWKPSKRYTTHLHVLSCYAPTYAAKREEKDRFYDNLQLALNEIPSNEPYIILGDFNARVGMRPAQDVDQWDRVRGPHGLGNLNDASKEFLSFLSLNEATLCNTWFMKKNINKCTWQHPKSNCIDYAVMRQRDRKLCLDATVMRGAECHTDHKLLRIKLTTDQPKPHRKIQRGGRRYNVSKLREGKKEIPPLTAQGGDSKNI